MALPPAGEEDCGGVLRRPAQLLLLGPGSVRLHHGWLAQPILPHQADAEGRCQAGETPPQAPPLGSTAIWTYSLFQINTNWYAFCGFVLCVCVCTPHRGRAYTPLMNSSDFETFQSNVSVRHVGPAPFWIVLGKFFAFSSFIATSAQNTKCKPPRCVCSYTGGPSVRVTRLKSKLKDFTDFRKRF